MFALALCVAMLVIGSMAGPRPPYEEDSTHFDEQEIQNFLKLSGKLYVRMRNYKQGTNFKCHYVEKVGAEGEHSYVYTLKARNGSGYFGNNLTVTPTRTGDHEKNNALQYTTPNSDQVIVKLMAKDTENSCFIFVRNTTESRSRKGCDLLMTASTVKGNIPEHCDKVFRNNCFGQNVTLYADDCQDTLLSS